MARELMAVDAHENELIALSSDDLAQAAMCWAVLRRVWPAEQQGFVRLHVEPTSDPDLPHVTALISRWHTLEECLEEDYKPLTNKRVPGATIEMTVEGACAMRALLKDTLLAAASGDAIDVNTLVKAVEVYDALLMVSNVTS